MHDVPIKQRRRLRVEWLALSAALLIVGAAFCSALYRERGSVQARESDRLQIQARVIDENLIRQLEGANKALEGVRDDVSQRGAKFDAGLTSGKLRLLTAAMPGVSTMLVLDAEGMIVASSREDLKGRNFRQRAYFEISRRHADPAVMYVSPPFKSTLGTFVIVVTRVLTDAKGDFSGIVTATLDPDYFKVVLESVLYAPDMRTTLMHGSGSVFLNMPENAPAPNFEMDRAGSLFEQHQQNRGSPSLLEGVLLASGEERMVAMRDVSSAGLKMDKPMVIAVSRDRAALYAGWRERSAELAALLAAIALASGISLRLYQLRRQSSIQISIAVERERQAGMERIELALRGADLGLWDLHIARNELVVNPRERAMLGLSPEDDLPQGKAWRKLIHPDDLSTVDASILPHLRGEAPNYECEHRMLHRQGHWVWVSNRAMIVERGPDGTPLRIIGTHLDVTERKRTEAELSRTSELLRESEEQFRQVTDNVPALVSRVDRDLRFRFVNRAYKDWLHIEPSAMIGCTLADVYGENALAGFHHHVKAALAGERVTYQRELATPNGAMQVEVTLVPHVVDSVVLGYDALMSDITARFKAELSLALSQERLSLALEASALSLFDWDIETGSMYHSAQASALRGEPAVETTTAAVDFQAFVHPEDLPLVLERMKDVVTDAAPRYDAEFRLRRISGDWVWIRARGRVVERSGRGRAIRLAGTYADINDRKVAELRLRHLADVDGLTGLSNRTVFQDRLEQAMMRAARGKIMALMFLDIDHFKSVNDTLGHEAGDELLKIFATRMRQAVRQSDTVARLGGDEFTIILEGLNQLDDAMMLADKLVTTLRQPVFLSGSRLEVSVSVGVAICIPGETEAAALVRRADKALYEAKRLGRNRYSCEFFEDHGVSSSAVRDSPLVESAAS